MKTLRFAMSLAFIAGLTVINAKAQTAEETLAKIEKDFAAAQITKNPKAFEAIAAVMSDDFYSFNPTTGVRLTKKELIAALQSPQYVASKMEFPTFFIRIFGSTAVVQGTNYELGSINGKEFSGTYAWFDVFEKRDARWVWIVSQRVRSMTRSLRRPSASLARGAPEPSKDFRCTSPDRACVMLPLVWKTTYGDDCSAPKSLPILSKK